MSKSRRSNRNTQIVIVDDHRILCQGLCEMLRRERGFKVSGTAHDAEAAKEIIARVTPDIVLLGDSVPRWAVSTATRYIRKVSPHTRIIVLRSRQQGAAANRSSRSMVMTVPKRAPFKDLVAVLRQTAQNVDTGAPGTARPGTKAGKNTRAKPAITNTLTVRQREIIAMIADGYSVKEAALRLKLSHKTVETHRRAIMTKLGLRNTADITRYALREGLTSL